MISFQIVQNGNAIQICVDNHGIDALVDVLTRLRNSGAHVHLWSDMGRERLSNKTPSGEEAIAEVIISHGGD